MIEKILQENPYLVEILIKEWDIKPKYLQKYRDGKVTPWFDIQVTIYEIFLDYGVIDTEVDIEKLFNT